MFPFPREAAGYTFTPSLYLHAKDSVRQYDVWVKVAAFLGARIQVILLLILLRRPKTLLRRFVPVGEGVSVHSMHVINTARPYLPEVVNQKVSFLL